MTSFSTGRTYPVKPNAQARDQKNLSSHGGGDLGLMSAFIAAVRANDQTILGTTVDEALEAHTVVFAAEHARRTRSTVDIAQFRSDQS